MATKCHKIKLKLNEVMVKEHITKFTENIKAK